MTEHDFQNRSHSTSFRFFKDIINYIPAKLVPALIALMWSFVFTRSFPPEQFGVYGLIISVTAPLVTVVTEWAAQPIGRFYAEYNENNLQLLYGAIVRQLIKIIFLILIVLIFFVLIVTFFYSRSHFLIAIAACLSVVVSSITSLITPILPASLNATSFRRFEMLRPVLRMIIALFLVFGVYNDIVMLIWADAIATLVLLIPLFKRTLGKEKKHGFDFKAIKPHILRFCKYGLPMMIWFFSSQLLNVGDRFVIQYFQGGSEVGIYTANYSLISGISTVLSAPVTLAAFPLIMKLWASGRKDELPEAIKNMTLIYGIISIAMLGGTYLIAKPLVTILLAPEYAEGYTILLPVLAGMVLWQGSILGHKGMELFESTGTMVRWIFIAAVVNFILNLIFVPFFGYDGAAWVTLVSYFLYTFFIWLSSKKYIRWILPVKSLIPYLLIGLIAVLLSSLFNFISSAYLLLLIKGGVFTLIYSVGSLVLYYLKKKKKTLKVLRRFT